MSIQQETVESPQKTKTPNRVKDLIVLFIIVVLVLLAVGTKIILENVWLYNFLEAHFFINEIEYSETEEDSLLEKGRVILPEQPSQTEIDYGVAYDEERAEQKLDELLELYEQLEEGEEIENILP